MTTARAQLLLFDAPKLSLARAADSAPPVLVPVESRDAGGRELRGADALDERRPTMRPGGKAADAQTCADADRVTTTRNTAVAQSEEHPIPNRERVGSKPACRASYTETVDVLRDAAIGDAEGRSRPRAAGTASRRLSESSGALSPAGERDAALARHAQDEHKRRLREAADVVARDLIARDGATCSPRVVAELRARGLGHLLFGLDPRAMGTVLLPTRGYVETGEYVNEGSKGRPAKMWRLA